MRFTLRTLFVVVTLLAISGAWEGWQYRIVAERKAMVDQLKTAGGLTTIGLASDGNIVPWQRRIFGDQHIRAIHLPYGWSEREAEIRKLFPESIVMQFPATQQRD